MDRITSTAFQKAYPRLTGPTEVTSNGHVIGTYYPAGVHRPVDRQPDPEVPWSSSEITATNPVSQVTTSGPALLDPSIKATGGPVRKDTGSFPPAKAWGDIGHSRPAPKPSQQKKR